MFDHLPRAWHLRPRQSITDHAKQRFVVGSARERGPGEIRALPSVSGRTVAGRAVAHEQPFSLSDVGLALMRVFFRNLFVVIGRLRGEHPDTKQQHEAGAEHTITSVITGRKYNTRPELG